MAIIITKGFLGKGLSREALKPSNGKVEFAESSANGEQARITCSPQVVSGVDKLKVTCWVNFTDRQIFERLETHKRCLQETKNNKEAPYNFTESETKYNFNIHRTGTTKFSYRLTTGDITILLSPRLSSSALHNTQIEIGSLSCQEDAQGVFNEIITMFNSLGGILEKNIVQEIHLAADLLGVPIRSTFFHYENNWITRAHNFEYFSYRRKMTGISLGSGDFMFRAYDKIQEMKIKRETSKQDFFAKKWGQDLNQLEVTRCEFQIRRPILKEFDTPCTTVIETFDNLQALWNYAVFNWARCCSAPVDRKNKNQQRSKITEHWKLVQTACFARINGIARRIRQPLLKNIDALTDQFRGIAMSIAASHGCNGDMLSVIIRRSQETVAESLKKLFEHDESEFRRRMQIRFNECYSTVL